MKNRTQYPEIIKELSLGIVNSDLDVIGTASSAKSHIGAKEVGQQRA